MGKRVRLTDNSINSYGSRVLTSGLDISQYEKNPVLLYMHERGNVIGLMKNIRREEDGSITAEPVFDGATDLSRQCKKQWDFGSLKMVSIGIDILELSEEPELLEQGQTSPTVTKSKLFEVSIVDIGANDNAIVLRKDGKQITLGAGGDNPLPQLSNNNKKEEKEMDLKTLALQLGLPETATEAEVNAKLAQLQASHTAAEKLRKENEQLTLGQITAAVDAAVASKKIAADKKDHFIELGRKVGIESLQITLDAMAPQVKLSQTINNTDNEQQPKTYSKLSEVPEKEMLKLREENPEEYHRLYKAEYGIDF